MRHVSRIAFTLKSSSGGSLNDVLGKMVLVIVDVLIVPLEAENGLPLKEPGREGSRRTVRGGRPYVSNRCGRGAGRDCVVV